MWDEEDVERILDELSTGDIWSRAEDEHSVLEYCCPSCGNLIEAEVWELERIRANGGTGTELCWNCG